MDEWTNFGDISFSTFGGCLCRPHFGGGDVDSSPVVDVLYFDPDNRRGNAMACGLFVIDTDGLSPQTVYDILYAAGLESDMPSIDEMSKQSVLEKYGRGFIAKEAVSSAGLRLDFSNINGDGLCDDELFYMTPEQIVSYSMGIGAGEYFDGLV